MVIFVKPIYNINRFELQECGDFTWRLSDCEELSGGYSQEMMGLVLVGGIVLSIFHSQSCKLCSYFYNRIVFRFSFHHLPKSPSTSWSDIKIEGDGTDLK